VGVSRGPSYLKDGSYGINDDSCNVYICRNISGCLTCTKHHTLPSIHAIEGMLKIQADLRDLPISVARRSVFRAYQFLLQAPKMAD